MKITTYIFTFLIGAASLANAQEAFKIQGKLTGLTSPMKVMLRYNIGDNHHVDSSITKDGKFNFKGKISGPARAELQLNPVQNVPAKKLEIGDVLPMNDAVSLMLQPGTTEINGASLSTATIKGGQAQADYAQFEHMIDSIGEFVYQTWKAQTAVLPEDSAASFRRLIYARSELLWLATKDFVMSHPNSAVSYDILTRYSIIIEKPEDFAAMYNSVSQQYKNSADGKVVGERVEMATKFAVGQKAIDFSQTSDKGQTVSLSSVNKGKYVLIDFWASWCGPCRMEYPFLKKAYARFKDKNFEIIGISLDDDKSLWLNAIKSNGFEWIQLCDLKGRQNEIAKKYGVAAIPQSFLLDPEGKIVAKNLRGDDLLEKLGEIIK
ncbi:TlpA disulfide reductase family protein [Pedobacter deserti]|uniref:TlpA disulfide reductase family protein n=1 Tax=Pedobacter deserti TaxID=2817382 RepID=UPI00210923CC|nr:TlpA disulfide reductase family protein [Pedobacter sp. SYSU D00382]